MAVYICSGNWTQYAIAIDPAEKLRKYFENKRKKMFITNSRIQTRDYRSFKVKSIITKPTRHTAAGYPFLTGEEKMSQIQILVRLNDRTGQAMQANKSIDDSEQCSCHRPSLIRL